MFWKKNSVLWTWTCSYILIFLIFLTAVFVNYGISTEALKGEIISVNELTFNNASDSVDHLLKNLRTAYVSVYLNDQLADLGLQEAMDPAFYRQTKALQEELYDFCNVEDKLFCMVYIKEKDYLIAGLNSCSAELYHSGMQHLYKDFIGYEAWKEVLNQSYSEDYLVTEGVNFWTSEKCMMYASTINRNRGEEYNIMISMPLERVESALGYLKEDAWLLMHMDGQPSVVFHNGKMTEAPDWVEEEDFYIRMQKVSAVPGVSYELVFSEQSVVNELQGVRTNFWMNLTLTMLLAVGGMIILLRINYRPIRTIMDEIGEEEERSNQNEFELMKGLFDRLTSEKRKTERLVEQQNKELMNSRLLMLMKGRGKTVRREDEEENPIPLLHQNIALVGFMIPVQQEESGCDIDLQFFIVDNIFSELMEKEHFYHVEDGSFSFYLFDLEQGRTETWRRDVTEKMELVCSMLYDKWGVSVIGVVGKEGENIESIKYLYQNVMAAFEYGKVFGGHGVMDVSFLPHYDESQQWEDDLEQRLRELFENREQTAVFEIVRQTFHHIGNRSTAVLKIRTYEAFSIAMDIFREYISDISLQEIAFSYLERLIKARTVDEMMICFEELLKFQMGTIAKQQMKEGKAIVIKVMNYVQENYADCNLNLNSLAEGLGKNSRYISRTFKKEMETGILDYINSVRIEKARELMATGKYTVQEAAEAVGYSNVRTFRRAFEKIAGQIARN